MGAIPDGYVVLSADSLMFGNTGLRIDATVLHADIRGSTGVVDEIGDTQAAEYENLFGGKAGGEKPSKPSSGCST